MWCCESDRAKSATEIGLLSIRSTLKRFGVTVVYRQRCGENRRSCRPPLHSTLPHKAFFHEVRIHHSAQATWSATPRVIGFVRRAMVRGPICCLHRCYQCRQVFLMLRAGATWAIRRSSSSEDLSDGRNRWLVNRVFSAASYSRSMNNSYINFLLQHLTFTLLSLRHEHTRTHYGSGTIARL
jgi:hypothetical protein